MQRHPTIFLLLVLMVLWFAQSTSGKDVDLGNLTVFSSPEQAALPLDLRRHVIEMIGTSIPADTTLLAMFTFGTNGVPDLQGWTSHDRTVQLDTFFHVADTTELNGAQSGFLIPLQGNQSLWCGVPPSTQSPYCNYATLPGYGNGWNQFFDSVAFPIVSDATLSYRVRWDSEPGYDETTVEYQDVDGYWNKLPVNGGVGFYDGTGDLTESLVIGSASAGDSLRLRFRFSSDGGWSDEDGRWPTEGAILIDSLLIMDATGTIDYQDFETESPGGKTTSDGDWFAHTGPAFGDFATLYPGGTVLQEDPCVSVLDFIWGFFDDPAITYYRCGPVFPEQGAIRYGKRTSEAARGCLEIQNEIWSPPIELVGTGDDVRLSFLVYRDMPLDGLVFYYWWVRSWVDGECIGPWKNSNYIYYGGQKDWARVSFPIGGNVDPGATHIQVAIGVVDMCSYWCMFGCGDGEACHAHAPLINDVRLDRINYVGPQFTVAHADLFQDNFAEDGTLVGVARADCARDIAGSGTLTIRPGDSLSISVGSPSGTLATDPYTGVGPAVYAYVSIRPNNQPGKSGADLESPEMEAIGKRYPLVGSLDYEGAIWHRYRMDSVRTGSGVVEARYCFDLNDDVFTPGDTIRYVLGAEGSSGDQSYWSRLLDGQGDNFVTDDLEKALDTPCEFTILPAGGWKRGGEILFVDVSDDRGGPVQLYFDSAFDVLGLGGLVDRYDVLSPTSRVNNNLASRVTDAVAQINDCYRTILWCTGNIASVTISNGILSWEKADDYTLLFNFLDSHPDNPGLYLSGDNIAYNWNYSGGAPGATILKTTYMNFNFVNGNHVSQDEPVSPLLILSGQCFAGDTLVVHGGCPTINDFDVIQATGVSVSEGDYPNGSGAAVLSQATTNSSATVARVVMSGFGYNYIRDTAPGFPPARIEHLENILTWFENDVDPVAVTDPTPRLTNFLGNAYPNPFNPTTTIHYSIRERAHVSLKVYNVTGQLVKTLVNEVKTPRAEGFVVEWNATNNANQQVSSGMYFYRLETKDFSKTKKMLLLK